MFKYIIWYITLYSRPRDESRPRQERPYRLLDADRRRAEGGAKSRGGGDAKRGMVYIYIYIYIHIHTYIERERERDVNLHV